MLEKEALQRIKHAEAANRQSTGILSNNFFPKTAPFNIIKLILIRKYSSYF
jgi:hypothetical protein